LPISLEFVAKLVSGLNLLAGHGGLFGRQQTRTGFAVDGAGETEIGAVARLGIFGAGAAGLAALNGTFRESRRMGLGSARSPASWRRCAAGGELSTE